MSAEIRIGFGYDVHAFSHEKELIIGGVTISHDKGLLGHSDADVLLHAICDAMLGSLALGDIGKHFPNNDPQYKDIDSKILLKKTNDLINEFNYIVGNLDSTVVIQEPKLAQYINSMRTTIAGILNVKVEQVSVKATTSEHLGFIGREEGAAAYATVLLIKKVN